MPWTLSSAPHRKIRSWTALPPRLSSTAGLSAWTLQGRSARSTRCAGERTGRGPDQMAASYVPSFSSRFNSQFSYGQNGKLTARLGLNVLDDLIAGIDEFHAEAAHNTSARDLGPAMLGAFGWLDDPQLLKRIAEYPYACVAFTKQPRPFPPAKLARLRDALARCNGFPADAL